LNISEIIKKQEMFRNRVLPLQPSENTIPRKALRAISSDFEQRYSLIINSDYRNQRIRNAYAGTRYSEELVEAVEKLAMSVFRTGFADVRPISGHIAAIQVIGNLMKRGDRFLYVPVESGGYDGYTPQYLPSIFGIRGEKMPMKGWKIDYEKMHRLKDRFEAVILGASIFLHPYRIAEVREAFPSALVLYDASHALGLLANGEFQPDFNKADVIYGSTHKNFPGPQGGIIVGRRELEEKVKNDAIWKYYDNFHLSRVSSLGISLEYLQGHDYGRRCIRNSRALVKNLRERNVKMANEPEVTESAMFLLDYEDIPLISRRLEKSNILVDNIGRIGVNEVTMLGLGEEHMELVADALHLGINSKYTEARRKVEKIRSLMKKP